MPYRQVDPGMADRNLRLIEATNAIASALMVVLLMAACVLLDRNHRQMALMEAQLALRNSQAAVSQELLRKMVERLDKLKPPLAAAPPSPR